MQKASPIVLALVVLGGGCDGATQFDPRTAVVNPEPGPADITNATEIVRVGSVAGDGPDLFGRVAFVAVDTARRLYVGDEIAQDIRVFSETGGYRYTLGRRGEGPGEFDQLRGMVFDPSGRGWVWDSTLKRFSVFSAAGTLVRTVSRTWPTLAIPWPGIFSSDGELLDVAADLRDLDRTRAVTQRFQHASRVVRFDSLMSPIDSGPVVVAERTAVGGNYIVPFEGGVVMALDRDGSAWSTHGPDYRIIRTDPQGDTILSFSVDAPMVPVIASERDSAIATMRRARRTAEAEDVIPKHKPAVVRLVRLRSGWLGAFPELNGNTGRFLDVFAPDGVLRQRVDLGVSLEMGRGAPVVQNGILYGVVTNQFDVPFVVGLDLGIADIPGDGLDSLR